MKIKDHPYWHWSASGTYSHLIKNRTWDYGEYILKEVRYFPKDEDGDESARVGLTAEHQGQKAFASLSFDDENFAEKAYKKLNACIGKTVNETGEIDF